MRGLIAILALTVLAAGALGRAGEAKPEPELDKLMLLIKPKTGESTWAEIPWMASLTDARKKAAAEGKPVAIWTMSGEPTGMNWAGGFGARAVAFANESTRRLIKERCVPFAYNGLVGTGFEAEDAFLGRMASQLPNHYIGNGNYTIVTPSGKVLGKDAGSALAEWEKLPTPERAPGAVTVEERGAFNAKVGPPQPPPGALVARVYLRGLSRDAQGQFAATTCGDIANVVKIQAKCSYSGDTNRDFLWLKDSEWKSLLPASPAKGVRGAVPPVVRDRILGYFVGRERGLEGVGWHSVRSNEMNLQVEEVTAAGFFLSLKGSAAMADAQGQDVCSAQVLGKLRYDHKKSAFTGFDVAALVERLQVKAGDCYKNGNPIPRWLGVAIELAGDGPEDRLPPFRAWRGNLDGYFANR